MLVKKPNIKQFSKWFQFLMRYAGIVTTIALICWPLEWILKNPYVYIVDFICGIYMLIFLITFFIEVIMRLAKSSSI